MKKNFILIKSTILFLLPLLWGCSSEKNQLVPGTKYNSLQNLVTAFKIQDVRLIPFIHNFKNKPPQEDFVTTMYTNFYKYKLFISEDNMLSNGGTKSLPALMDWKNEDLKVQNFLNTVKNDDSFFIYNQECALGMLTKTNLIEDRSSESFNVLEKYLNVLFENGTYSPGLFYFSLKKLKTNLTNEKIKLFVSETTKNHPKFSQFYDTLIYQLKIPKEITPFGMDMILCQQEIKRQNEFYLTKLKSL